MKLANIFKSTIMTIRNSLKRFPITILISTSLVILLITLIEKGSSFTAATRDVLERVSLILALGIPLSVCIDLIFERKEEANRSHRVFGHLIGIAFLIFYYFLFLSEINWISITRYVGISIFFYLAFAFIPWIGKKDGYENYMIDVISSFILTMIYSFVLFIGIVVILFTIHQLFNINIPDNFVLYSFIIIGGIFAPSNFLARIPLVKKDTYIKDYPRALKILLLYIVMPLITVYSLILYLYFLKIIITRNWPQGLVSHLVLWYSIVSVAVIYFISPILKDNKWAEKFKGYFPKFIIPILIMMFISMGIRISAYGLTENRYYGIVMGLWVTGIMLYFSLKKQQKNIVIPVSLAILVLISVFGPLSSFSVSKFSQNKRLESILKRNGMLEGNEIIAKSDIAREDKEEISMILMYFKNKHSLKDVKYLDEGFNLTDKDMETVFGFPFTEKDIFDRKYFHYYAEYDLASIIDVKDYDYFINSNVLVNEERQIENLTLYFQENGLFKILQGDSILYERNLAAYVSKILEDYSSRGSEFRNTLAPEDTILIDDNERVGVKFILSNISGQYDDINKQYHINYIECFILIKIK